jgi:hypothetical protein
MFSQHAIYVEYELFYDILLQTKKIEMKDISM